ncbi:MAG: hypothetical protein ACYC67_10360 [Prosthecobacter sp.]
MKTTKSKTTSALAIPTMAPPVKKSEVIEALYLLALEKFTAQEKEKATRRAEIAQQWEDGLKPLLDSGRSINFGKPHDWDTSEIRLSVKTTPHLKQLGKQWDKNLPSSWNEKAERQRIAEKMASNGSRAKDLLADPASKAALEKILSKIDG